MEQPAQLDEASNRGSQPASPRQAHILTKLSAPKDAGWSSPVARQAHNLKVVGSNPTPATKFLNIYQILSGTKAILFALFAHLHQRHINILKKKHSDFWTTARS